ncbi:MAG: AraC family transcriptional regulator [Lentimicrobiaceae bacterium]|nr:AraC family transcriptional regulator [Lentimicrobiaceae bacterium]
MFKKNFLIVILLFSIVIYGQSQPSNLSQNSEFISNFKHLSAQQLLDTAEYYIENNLSDIALACYSLIINTPVKDTDFEQQKKKVTAYNGAAIRCYYMCDYRSAYEFLIKALILCEKINYVSHYAKIYNNIGNIYYRFKKYDIAKLNYAKALNLCHDTASIVVILNNLGSTDLEGGKMDSAFYFFNKSLTMSKLYNDVHSFSILNNIALLYKKEKQYDSAFYYFRLSLNESRKNNKTEKEADNLSSLSNLFFEINKYDSALFYADLSNTIAVENNFLEILAENYLTISKIEELKGSNKKSLENLKKYAQLKDSIFNTDIFGDINQLQRLYEISKTDQQIEQLYIEQQIKERTIYFQKILWFGTLCVLLLLGAGLLFFYLQNRNLNRAYKALFEKNIEIIDIQEKSSEIDREKVNKKVLVNKMQDELIDKIITVMEDTTLICDMEFSIDKLAELVESNQKYVSQAVNTVFRKNFRSFLNSYRIKEAQRLFSEPDAVNYTIESVALKVGFKSRTAFRDAFKEITGINPNLYLKLMQEARAS